MSIRFLTWAFQLPLQDMAAKGVLNALADHADEGGRSWPSVARLALYTGCDEKTARRALARLVALGLVERSARPGKSDVFVLRMDVDHSQIRPLPNSTPPSVTPPNEARTPPNVTGHPSQRDPDPSHGGSRTFMNPQRTVITRRRVREAAGAADRAAAERAKWEARLAGYRPWEGREVWQAGWGWRPDSAGDNPLIPKDMLEAWRVEWRASRGQQPVA